MLSARLARTLARGRAVPGAPESRPRLLAALLRKRAAAAATGDAALEALLRAQIRWSLPIDRGEG